jgi:hypothetical protein
MKRLLLIPYAFVLMNWAAVTALWCFLRRRRLQTLWLEDGVGRVGRRPGHGVV